MIKILFTFSAIVLILAGYGGYSVYEKISAPKDNLGAFPVLQTVQGGSGADSFRQYPIVGNGTDALQASSTLWLVSINATSTTASSTFQGLTSESFRVANGFLQGGFTNCDADNETVSYNATSGKFSCGDDDTGAAASADLIYRLIGSSNYYTASSSATDNLVWHFNNGFVSNASSSFRGALIASSTLQVTGLTNFFNNVGIGTSTPYQKLAVGGTVVAANFQATTTATSSFAGPISSVVNGFSAPGNSLGRLIINAATTSGRLLLNPYGGLVSIASTSPNHVIKNNGSGFSVATTTFFGNNLSIGSTTPAARFSLQFTGTELPLLIGTSTGSTTFLINNSGNVGIGTTTPNQKLAVQGRVEALSFGGTAQTATSSIAGGLTARNLQLNGYSVPPLVPRNFSYSSTTGPDTVPMGPMFPQAFTITEALIRISCNATSSPDVAFCGGGVNFQIYHGASQNSTTTLFSNNLQNVNSTNTSQIFTNFNDNTIAANELLFFRINSASSSITVPQHWIEVAIRGYYDP